MGGWCKERYNKEENNKLEGLHQKLDQMEETHWEGQNFSEVVAPQEEEVIHHTRFHLVFLKNAQTKRQESGSAKTWKSDK